MRLQPLSFTSGRRTLETPKLDDQWISLLSGDLIDKVDLKPWQPQRAKREFLERYEELVNARNAFRPTQAAA